MSNWILLARTQALLATAVLVTKSSIEFSIQKLCVPVALPVVPQLWVSPSSLALLHPDTSATHFELTWGCY
ncbi:17629_t:CDS:2, partial [Acaulospora colombiana]